MTGRFFFPFALLLAALAAWPAPNAAGTPAAGTPIVIGAEDDWYPYSALRDGKPVGLAVDLVAAAFRRAGVAVELRPLPYARCMQLARQSKIAGCFDTLRNPRLEPLYRWHAVPLFSARILIYASTDRPAETVGYETLVGKLIAVTNGYDYGERFDGDMRMRRDPGLRDIDALRKLAAGRVDYALVYEQVANALLREDPALARRIRPVGVLIAPDIYLSFAPAYPASRR
ncbi:substrate-binding periplasmic protein [Chitinimonas koreensis]|uniref:substrate-binding periplasmic protein n=1 Tax=Chitinimonas koreensis TaxID=356302 RepID=UPI0016545A4A|nr:transporter substrate-binding domain-containing protein [Chitinimonas koreensis]QNM95652.1 transporter substrate-binding domain-containing protein [Chitinimonas koreensis]